MSPILGIVRFAKKLKEQRRSASSTWSLPLLLLVLSTSSSLGLTRPKWRVDDDAIPLERYGVPVATCRECEDVFARERVRVNGTKLDELLQRNPEAVPAIRW
jgi:hypothetical protein